MNPRDEDRPALDTRKDCTCLGTCKGAEGLGPGWRCALEIRPPAAPVSVTPAPGSVERPKLFYFCNKCGYSGRHERHGGCDYIASPSEWQRYALHLEARLREYEERERRGKDDRNAFARKVGHTVYEMIAVVDWPPEKVVHHAVAAAESEEAEERRGKDGNP
jgi:hypothetical protein